MWILISSNDMDLWCFKKNISAFSMVRVIFSVPAKYAHENLSADAVCFKCNNRSREGSGSVVECLTQDRGSAGTSLTGVTALCP